MQKHLAIGRVMKILDQKNRGGGGSTNPPPCQFKVKVAVKFVSLIGKSRKDNQNFFY